MITYYTGTEWEILDQRLINNSMKKRKNEINIEISST